MPVSATVLKTAATNRNTEIKKIASGNQFVLALLADGTVWGVGVNGVGQLGNTDGSGAARVTDAVQSDSSKFDGSVDAKFVVDIACGSLSSYAITKDGKVWSWGKGTGGELGDTSNNSSTTAREVVDASELLSEVLRASKANEYLFAHDAPQTLPLSYASRRHPLHRHPLR